MADLSERELFEAISAGDDHAFERIYDRYQQRARLMAWRISHRSDWVDDLLNEAWCRAFRLRKSYDPGRPFAVWLAGILQNVYREHCRKSPTTFDGDADALGAGEGPTDEQDPESTAAEAELLSGLNDCLSRLDPIEARIVRLRFFEEKTLRSIAKEVTIPESTIREVRLPAAYQALRRCLRRKGIPFFEISTAQDRDQMQ